LEWEDTLLGFSEVFGTGVFPVRGLSIPGEALLGDCLHSVQEDVKFSMGCAVIVKFSCCTAVVMSDGKRMHW
jgi:hypothetical protein